MPVIDSARPRSAGPRSAGPRAVGPRTVPRGRPRRFLALIPLAVLAAAALDAAPAAAATGTPYLYVGSGLVPGDVIPYNLATSSAGDPIRVGGAEGDVTSIVASPDGRTVYVGDTGSFSVSVIDTATNSVTATIPVPGLPSGPNAIALSPDGSTLYASNGAGATVSVIDTTSDTVSKTIPVSAPGTGGIAVSPDGKTLYYLYVPDSGGAVNPGYVSAMSTAGTAIGNPIPVGEDPLGIAISPDGKTGYTANFGSNNVSAITIADGTVATTPVQANIGSVAVSPDGGSVYAASFDTVSRISPVSKRVITTYQVGAGASSVAVSPDSSTVCTADASDNAVSVITPSNIKVNPVATIRGFDYPQAVAVTSVPAAAS